MGSTRRQRERAPVGRRILEGGPQWRARVPQI